MKFPNKWSIKLYQPDSDSVNWRFLFNFIGVESFPLRSEKKLRQSLLSDEAGLVVFDRNLLGEAFSALEPLCSQWLERGGGIALTGQAGKWPIPDPFLAKVTDISQRDPFTINALLQRFVPTYSRQHPRLGNRLPGLYTRSTGNCQLCEIMNLNPGGAFIRTTEALPASGEELRVIIPLIGLQKEIELNGLVVSQLFPNEANNFSQGIGIKFIGERNPLVFTELNNYVRYVLAHDETLDPQVTPVSGNKSKKIGHNVKSLAAKTEKRQERPLAANY